MLQCSSWDGLSLKLNTVYEKADAPAYHDGSNEPTLASQFEWSVNTINVLASDLQQCFVKILKILFLFCFQISQDIFQ